MLIVCPSCASSYEIPAVRLGAKGRSVRCKNCGEAWYAARPDAFAAAVAPLLELAEEEILPRPERAPEQGESVDGPAGKTPDAEPPAVIDVVAIESAPPPGSRFG